MARREPFFECIFSADRNDYRFHFRAWSAEEAEAHLRDDLRESGVDVAGEVRVLDEKGRVLRQSHYGPSPRVGEAADAGAGRPGPE